jgi:hypothetical protein
MKSAPIVNIAGNYSMLGANKTHRVANAKSLRLTIPAAEQPADKTGPNWFSSHRPEKSKP